ncbi:MBL fold metallo-hydrolase [Flavitalea flava]
MANISLPIAFSFFVCLLANIHFSQGQSLRAGIAPNTDPSMDARGNAFMDRQAKALLAETDSILTKHPPGMKIPGNERHLGLLLMDAVLHDVYAAYRLPVQEFYHHRIEDALDEMEKTRVEKGAVIWKLYNMGFIVKTRTTTFAFDLVSGVNTGCPAFALSEKTIDRLVSQCDALFLSHRHQDHVEETIAWKFIKSGKPVVAPLQIWADKPIHRSITHLQRVADSIQFLPVQQGKQVLKVIIYPGHQMENNDNNVSLVTTPEGLSFCHMGDQINEGKFMIDYAWIDSVFLHQRVDVLMPPCWTNEIYRIVKGFNPHMVIPGHENELGHRVDDRVPFWGDAEFLDLTYPELKRSNYKVVNMTWGESLRYHR